jgi:putative peptidoglycan lipid II flippase
VANTLVWATLLVTVIGIIASPLFIYAIASGLKSSTRPCG